MNTQKNLGIPDRVVRIVIGIALIAMIVLAFIGPQSSLAYLGLLGVFPLVSGITGYCVPYKLMGINTYKGENTAQKTAGGEI